MSGAFEQAWEDVAKDFYFDPETAKFNIKDHGIGTSFSSVMGRYEAPQVNALRDTIDPSAPWSLSPSKWLPPETFEPGKHIPVVLPRTHVMERHSEMGGAPIDVDNYYYGGPEGLNHYLGVNLSAINMPGRTEEQMIDDIINGLVHEHGHAAIDNDLTREYYLNALEAKNYEEAEQRYKQHVGAHEFGAYNLQYPGGEDAERLARWDLISHPNWKLANSHKIPRAHIR